MAPGRGAAGEKQYRDPARFARLTLREQLADHFALDVGQTKFAALESVGQAGVVEPEPVQQSGVQVVDRDGILDNVVADIVRTADGDAGLDAAACEPHCECAGMMIAAEELRAAAGFVHGGAAKLSAPDNQRRIEKPALLQIFDE